MLSVLGTVITCIGFGVLRAPERHGGLIKFPYVDVNSERMGLQVVQHILRKLLYLNQNIFITTSFKFNTTVIQPS